MRRCITEDSLDRKPHLRLLQDFPLKLAWLESVEAITVSFSHMAWMVLARSQNDDRDVTYLTFSDVIRHFLGLASSFPVRSVILYSWLIIQLFALHLLLEFQNNKVYASVLRFRILLDGCIVGHEETTRKRPDDTPVIYVLCSPSNCYNLD